MLKKIRNSALFAVLLGAFALVGTMRVSASWSDGKTCSVLFNIGRP